MAVELVSRSIPKHFAHGVWTNVQTEMFKGAGTRNPSIEPLWLLPKIASDF
jgi:hypothetical protein